MGRVKAKQAGKCGKCRGSFKEGEEIGVEKGKPPLCAKCAPPAPEKKNWPGKVFGGPAVPINVVNLTPWDLFAAAAFSFLEQDSTIVYPVVNEGISIDEGTVLIISKASEIAGKIADAMMAERIKRGIK